MLLLATQNHLETKIDGAAEDVEEGFLSGSERAVEARFQRFDEYQSRDILVGAAHGVLSGQLAAGWLGGPVACFA